MEGMDQYYKGPTEIQFEEFGFDTTTNGFTIGKYGCQWSTSHKERTMSIRVGDAIGASSMWLLCTLLLSIVLIVTVSTLTRSKVKTDEVNAPVEYAVPEENMEVWWWYMRFIALLNVFAMCYSMLLSINVLNDMAYLKFPMPWITQRCMAEGEWTLVDPTCVDKFGDDACQYENGKILKYLSSYSGERLGKYNEFDSLASFGWFYVAGTPVLLLCIIVAGYAQHRAETVDERTPKATEDTTAENIGFGI